MNLRIPGPTPCPKEVLEAMNRQMINHRGDEFKEILLSTTERVKKVFQTKNDLFILTGSGTGGLEAAIVNFFSPGDKIISATVGYFGDRFATIAKNYGGEVRIVPNAISGYDVDPELFEYTLRMNRDAKGVLITHNETSTGVVNNLKVLAEIAKRYGVLVVVDAVSSMSAVSIPTDAWGLDVVVSASQKGWMAPPGLYMISVSEKAWELHKTAKMPRYYFDLGLAKQHFAKGYTLATQAIPVFFALDCALEMMLKEGLDNVFYRHARMAAYFRDKISFIGWEFFAQQNCRSNTITALKVPKGVDGKEFIRNLKDQYQVEVSGGIDDLEGKILRVAHMGFVSYQDLNETIEALRNIGKP